MNRKRIINLLNDNSNILIIPEHKINITIANFSLSLMNRGREVLVISLTQFLTSLETRPSAKAFKVIFY